MSLSPMATRPIWPIRPCLLSRTKLRGESMKTRKLGHSDLEITRFCLGGNVFGANGRIADMATEFAVLDAYVEDGGNYIDTADVYTKGESEKVIGRWMKERGNRDRIILATKVGMEMAPDKKGLSRKHILQSVEDSLIRLQTDV